MFVITLSEWLGIIAFSFIMLAGLCGWIYSLVRKKLSK